VIPAELVPDPKPSVTPLLDEALAFVRSSMLTAKCPEKFKSLGLIAASLRLQQRFSDDLTESCERDYYVRIARVLEQPDTQPVEEPEPLTDEEFSDRCAVQPDVEPEIRMDVEPLDEAAE
jgi:hypothetical protein